MLNGHAPTLEHSSTAATAAPASFDRRHGPLRERPLHQQQQRQRPHVVAQVGEAAHPHRLHRQPRRAQREQRPPTARSWRPPPPAVRLPARFPRPPRAAPASPAPARLVSTAFLRSGRRAAPAAGAWTTSAPCGCCKRFPGIDYGSACTILAEIGPDLGAFRKACSIGPWAGVAPGNNSSAGKRRSGRARKGNPTLRATLAECAHGAGADQEFAVLRPSPDAGRAPRLQEGHPRQCPTKLLRVIHAVLRDDRPYTDPDIDYEKLVVERNAPRWLRMLTRHGFPRRRRKQQRAAETNGFRITRRRDGPWNGAARTAEPIRTSPAHAQGPPTRGHAPVRPKHRRVSHSNETSNPNSCWWVPSMWYGRHTVPGFPRAA